MDESHAYVDCEADPDMQQSAWERLKRQAEVRGFSLEVGSEVLEQDRLAPLRGLVPYRPHLAKGEWRGSPVECWGANTDADRGTAVLVTRDENRAPWLVFINVNSDELSKLCLVHGKRPEHLRLDPPAPELVLEVANSGPARNRTATLERSDPGLSTPVLD